MAVKPKKPDKAPKRGLKRKPGHFAHTRYVKGERGAIGFAAREKHEIGHIELWQDNAVNNGDIDASKPLIVYGKVTPAFGAYDISIYLSCDQGYFPTIYAVATQQPGFDWEVTIGTEYDLSYWDDHFLLEAWRFTPRQTVAQIEFDVV